MLLAQLVFSQGFGTRRECEGPAGHFVLAGRRSSTIRTRSRPRASLRVGGDWPYREKALIAAEQAGRLRVLAEAGHHPSVYSLLPAPLRRRDVQPIGRLDEDTTGLLLFTDDGPLIHRLTSPKHTCPRSTRSAQAPVTPTDRALLAGVVLRRRPDGRCAPRPASATGERTLRLTLLEGKYHQVKRMLAAVGNRVEALHRSAFGAVTLPPGLAPGQWIWLDGPQAIDGAGRPRRRPRCRSGMPLGSARCSAHLP